MEAGVMSLRVSDINAYFVHLKESIKTNSIHFELTGSMHPADPAHSTFEHLARKTETEKTRRTPSTLQTSTAIYFPSLERLPHPHTTLE